MRLPTLQGCHKTPLLYSRFKAALQAERVNCYEYSMFRVRRVEGTTEWTAEEGEKYGQALIVPGRPE